VRPSAGSPSGRLKRAAGPVPSVLPVVPGEPASVVTTPVAMTSFRIVWLLLSALPAAEVKNSREPCGVDRGRMEDPREELARNRYSALSSW
jgi:hypothetical protein